MVVGSGRNIFCLETLENIIKHFVILCRRAGRVIFNKLKKIYLEKGPRFKKREATNHERKFCDEVLI